MKMKKKFHMPADTKVYAAPSAELFRKHVSEYDRAESVLTWKVC